MQTHEEHARPRAPKNGWGRRLTIVLIALVNMIFNTGAAQAKSLTETAVPPNAVSCGNTVAAPHQPGQQQVNYSTNQPTVVGLVLAPSDSMTVTINDKVGKFTNEENGHMWSGLVNSGAITMTTSSGPDSSFISFAAAANEFTLIPESLGAAAPLSPGTYEALEFALTPNGGLIKVCVLGAFNDPGNTTNVTYQLVVNGAIVDQVQLDESQHSGTLDLVELTSMVAANDQVKVVITTLENPNQAREEYFLIGLGIQGGRLTDQDGDGLPDPTDPQPETPRACQVTTGHSSAPHIVGKAFVLDIQYVGEDCTGFTLIQFMPGQFSNVQMAEAGSDQFVANDGSCVDFSGEGGNTELVCRLDAYRKFRITITTNKVGTYTMFATLSANRDDFRYWAEDVTVVFGPLNIRFYLPVIAR